MTDQAQYNAWTLICDDGGHWLACRQGERHVLTSEEGAFVPQLRLPDDGVIHSIVLPLEQLLVRTFQLPLAHPRLIDEDILAQEVEDMTGDEEDRWWLCWQAGEYEGGVRGLLLGLPMAWLQSLQATAWCQAVPVVTADAVFRLMRWISEDGEQMAVLDEDDSGMFIGVCEQGCWRGIRRLNRQHHDGGVIVEEIRASLQAMGWQEGEAVAGQLAAATLKACGFENWQGNVCDSLPDRHAETRAAAEGGISPAGLNFRRGKWQLSHPLFELKAWKRPLLMALILLLVWGVGQGYQLWSLQRMIAGYESRVIAAFRDALPTDPVIDPLAQLQRAAGGHAGGAQATTLLHDINILSQIYVKMPWTMKEIQFNGKQFEIRGEIRNLKQLNQLQRKLAQQLGRNVDIADTELGKGRVSFRMVWS